MFSISPAAFVFEFSAAIWMYEVQLLCTQAAKPHSEPPTKYVWKSATRRL